MTILRSTPFLGKEGLNDRPGRESGTKAPTPDAELMGKKINAKYFIRYYDKYDAYECAKNSKEILTPIISYQGAQFKNNTTYFVITNPKDKNLPTNYSAFRIEGDTILSTVKKAEGKDDLIIRLYNPDRIKNKTVKILDLDINKNLYEAALDEKPISKLDNNTIDVGTCEVKTIIIG